MQKLTRSELEKLVALQSNKYKKDVTLILDTYYKVLREAILTGYRVDVPEIGYFYNTQAKAEPEKERFNSLTGGTSITPAHEAYNRPVFRFRKNFKNDMRDETEGRVL